MADELVTVASMFWDFGHFLNGQLQHHLFGLHEAVEEECARWKHWTLCQRVQFTWLKGLGRHEISQTSSLRRSFRLPRRSR